MIYQYDVKIPLTYNRFALPSAIKGVLSDEVMYEFPDSETEVDVLFRTYDIPGYEGGYDFPDKVKIGLHKSVLPDAPFLCEVTGLLVDDEIYARKFARQIADNICKELSFVLMKHSPNVYLHQPRAEALWDKAQWSSREYTPYVQARRKALEERTGKIISEDVIRVVDSVSVKCKRALSCDEVNIRKWLFPKNNDMEFLMNEYYSALGTEGIKSKFFHLFAIIEFCEKKFEEHNGAKELLSEEEIDCIITTLKSVEMGSKDRVISSLTSNLMKMNNIGRIGKLKNILHWLGITSYAPSVENDNDRKILEGIVKLRNKSFHGTQESPEDAEQQYMDAVGKLLYIDAQILDFVMKDNPVTDNPDGYVLITGKEKWK